MHTEEITLETPVAQMTAGQLIDLMNTKGASVMAAAQAGREKPGRYVYGLRGIMQLFNVSNMTAQRYKNGILKDAVKQYGRKIVVDVDKALELFEAAREQR